MPRFLNTVGYASTSLGDVPIGPTEAIEAKRARVERELAIIAQAEADIDAGLGVEWDDLEPWLHELDHDPDAPAPEL